jgi:hypothetical protein
MPPEEALLKKKGKEAEGSWRWPKTGVGGVEMEERKKRLGTRVG